MNNCKGSKLLFLVTALLCVSVRAEDSQERCSSREMPKSHIELTTTIAQQALMCDFAGTGHLISQTSDSASINMINLWHGSFNESPLKIYFNDVNPGDINTNTMVIFFASTNFWWQALAHAEPPSFGDIYTFSLVTNPPTLCGSQTNQITMINDSFSLNKLLTINSDIEKYASNLVYKVKALKDEPAFNNALFEAMENPSRKIVDDALSYVHFRREHLPTNLTTRARQIILQRLAQ